MDEFIESDERNERKNKQDYLIKNIIEAQYDAEAFSDFLNNERHEGQNIDNWNVEELETMVALFKKTAKVRSREEELLHRLEEIELNDDDRLLYVKRTETAKKKKTVLLMNEVSVVVSNIEVLDGGLFYGKSLCFHIDIPQIDLRVRRTEPDFRWLVDSMSTEFPWVPLPPLLRFSEKFTEPGLVTQYKKYYEKFLNECTKHPELRNSIALEAFLVCQSKEEMSMKVKEMAKYYKKNILFDKNTSKKTFDAFQRDPLESLPTTSGVLTLKLSPALKSHLVSADGQYAQYDYIFDRIERLNAECQKLFTRLGDTTKQLKDALSELQSAAIKFNTAKEVKLKPNLVEDAVFGSVANYFDNFGQFIRKSY